MEITLTDLHISNYMTEYPSRLCNNNKKDDHVWIDNIRMKHNLNEINDHSLQSSYSNENSFYSETFDGSEPNLNSIQHETSTSSNNILAGSVYTGSLESDHSNERSNRCANGETGILIKSEDKNVYNISRLVIPSDILELSLSIKKETENFNSHWSIEESGENSCKIYFRVEEGTNGTDTNKLGKFNITKKYEIREINKRHSTAHQRLRKKAECMREKRKKLYDNESVEARLDRLSKEAAKRRDVRMYYETPEKRRRRLDNEAARKRDYRMYNETPEERRKRLDREAERRRLKRSTMYANETPEEKRDRLNRESSKRRESRLNQYAKETEKERQLRLEKDATRAREMRFTRSAIESDEERRKRLVKDALRKRELRMRSGDDRMRNRTELQTVRNFEELNEPEVQQQQQRDNQFGNHFISNWMMWVQNTISQPETIPDIADTSHETHLDA